MSAHAGTSRLCADTDPGQAGGGTQRVADRSGGTTTVTFRRWRRAQARAGGRYRVSGLLLEADAVELVPVRAITDGDARVGGRVRPSSPVARLRRQPGEPLEDSTLVWRVDFHLVGRGTDRAVLREAPGLSAGDLADPRPPVGTGWIVPACTVRGPAACWRSSTSGPASVSTELAAELGRDRPSFKLDVRKLKELGLTESLAVGYQLSPRGRATSTLVARRGGPLPELHGLVHDGCGCAGGDGSGGQQVTGVAAGDSAGANRGSSGGQRRAAARPRPAVVTCEPGTRPQRRATCPRAG